MEYFADNLNDVDHKMEEIRVSMEGLNNLRDTLISVRESKGSLSDQEQVFLRHAVDAHHTTLGISPPGVTISVESIGEVLHKVWEAICKAWDILAQHIMDFFKWLKNGTTRAQREARAAHDQKELEYLERRNAQILASSWRVIDQTMLLPPGHTGEISLLDVMDHLERVADNTTDRCIKAIKIHTAFCEKLDTIKVPFDKNQAEELLQENVALVSEYHRSLTEVFELKRTDSSRTGELTNKTLFIGHSDPSLRGPLPEKDNRTQMERGGWANGPTDSLSHFCASARFAFIADMSNFNFSEHKYFKPCDLGELARRLPAFAKLHEDLYSKLLVVNGQCDFVKQQSITLKQQMKKFSFEVDGSPSRVAEGFFHETVGMYELGRNNMSHLFKASVECWHAVGKVLDTIHIIQHTAERIKPTKADDKDPGDHEYR